MKLVRLVLIFASLTGISQAQSEDAVIRASFSAGGLVKVVLRAAVADKAAVAVGSASDPDVVVTAIPTGGARGYHSPDPNWKETPAAEWGMEFVSKAYGNVLVVSTKNEIRYIHHNYVLALISVTVPPGVEVVREVRPPSGDGAPDLSAPQVP